ncbi:hypothetical protein MUB24_22095 [Lederbergia sp. NSJ-179]|nr:hypothetical protein [Lederbergia sp. NSJ-179]MCJ7843516.1 hypothetical protein [Lederbergia sp. NSJ-179]
MQNNWIVIKKEIQSIGEDDSLAILCLSSLKTISLAILFEEEFGFV